MSSAARLGAAILASFGVACASPVEVRVEQRKDLAGYCTWNFLALWDGSVRAPLNDARALDATVMRYIEKNLLERGFVRVMGRPDFYVTFRLEVKRQFVIVSETPATETLSSLHNLPAAAYEIQVTNRRVEAFEIGDLAILVSAPDEEGVVWRGDLEGRYRSEIAPHLGEAVAKILARFPAQVSADASSQCGPRL
jgi:hypothetical protein